MTTTFSIVVPVYYNEDNLPETIATLLALEQELQDTRIELVLVDDGSGDRSLEIARSAHEQYRDRICVVKLTRNFGSMAAIRAGLQKAVGDVVGVISADLQDPPRLFIEMLEHWRRGVKAVYATRSSRRDSLLTRAPASAYYSLFRRFVMPAYPAGGFDFFVVDRQVIQELNSLEDTNAHLMALLFWLGFPFVVVPYVREARTKGRSRWTIAKKVKLFVDAFVGFSYLPIRALSVVGLVFASGAFGYGLLLAGLWYAKGIEVRGFTALMLMLSFTSGLQMVMLGVLGEYLWRTLDASRRRPAYVIDEEFSRSPI